MAPNKPPKKASKSQKPASAKGTSYRWGDASEHEESNIKRSCPQQQPRQRQQQQQQQEEEESSTGANLQQPPLPLYQNAQQQQHQDAQQPPPLAPSSKFIPLSLVCQGQGCNRNIPSQPLQCIHLACRNKEKLYCCE